MVQGRSDVGGAQASGQGPRTDAQGGALGKHEELSPTGCTCGPEYLRLRSNHGELVKPRGGCVNKCDYCAKLAAVENCEMLVLDALDGGAPTVITILGTRTPTVDMELFERGRKEVVRAARRVCRDAQYAYEVEFTTGYGPRAGGKRRPHWNWFWKNVDADKIEAFGASIIEAWCRCVDADPAAQYVDTIRNEIGLTKYVTQHFMKASQRPPKGFSGQRFCASRGYFGVSVRTARSRARESLRLKRELWKASQVHDNAHDVELAAREALELAYRTVWVLTNDRGARVGPVGHDPRRQVLPFARDRLHLAQLVAALNGTFDWRNLVAGMPNPPDVNVGVEDPLALF
jgi:hypothetical protein